MPRLRAGHGVSSSSVDAFAIYARRGVASGRRAGANAPPIGPRYLCLLVSAATGRRAAYARALYLKLGRSIAAAPTASAARRRFRPILRLPEAASSSY